MFNKIVSAVILASALASPVLAYAQNNDPVTRAQVKSELAQLQRAGYSQGGDQANYPEALQAAQKRVDALNAGASSYGGSTESISQAGGRSLHATDSVNPVDYNRP